MAIIYRATFVNTLVAVLIGVEYINAGRSVAIETPDLTGAGK
jgi:hypothetical protein